MNSLVTILDIACGRPIPTEDAGRARRLELVVVAILASLAFAAAWGVAIGSRALPFAVANAYKVPMVVLLSCAFAAPAGALAWRVAGPQIRGSDLSLGFASALFGGTLVLLVVTPLVALYEHSSAWAGPMLGMGSACVAMVTAVVLFVRGVMRRLDAGTPKRAVLIPVVVMVVMQLATLVQLAAVAAPIFPDGTVLSGGIDRLAQ